MALKVDGIELSFNRFSVMAWVYAWPTLLTLGLIWTGQRSRLRMAWLVYAAGLSWLCLRVTQAGTPPLVVMGLTLPAFAQVLFIAGNAIVPAPLLLLVLNRKVRSIGPVVMPMVLMCCVAGMGAVVLTSVPVLMDPLFHGLYAISPSLTGFYMPLSFVLGAALASPLAWSWAKVMRFGQASGWITDQSLVIDAIWLFQSLLLTLSISWTLGVAGLWGMSVFGVYKLVTCLGMRGAAQAAHQHRPRRLLLLRVFNRRDAQGRLQSRRKDSERLFDALGARWRYAGPNTQKAFLHQTLARCVANTPCTSPNAGHELKVRWIDTTDSEAQAVQALMLMSQDMPASGPHLVRQAA